MSSDSIEVRAFLSLAPQVGTGGRLELVMPAGPATVGAVAGRVGLAPESLGLILVNGCKADLETAVRPGDRVAFFPEYVPYHKVYGMCIL